MGTREAHFTVTVHDEDGQLWAEVAELPGCFAAGDDMNELSESLREALMMCLPATTVEIREWTRTDDSQDVRALVAV